MWVMEYMALLERAAHMTLLARAVDSLFIPSLKGSSAYACGMTHWHMWLTDTCDSLTHVTRGTRLIFTCATSHSHTWQDSFIQDSFIYDSFIHDLLTHDSIIRNPFIYDSFIDDSCIHDLILRDSLIHDSFPDATRTRRCNKGSSYFYLTSIHIHIYTCVYRNALYIHM